MGSLCIFGHLFREDSTFVFPEEEEAESWEQQNTSDTPYACTDYNRFVR